MKPWFFVTFNVIISHVSPANFIEIHQDIRFSPSILTIFNDFADLLTFPSHKETNDVAYSRWCQHFFYFQPTLNRLLNIIQCHIGIILVVLEIWRGGGVKLTPSRKNYFQKLCRKSHYSVQIQENRKIQTRNNSVFGHFSRSEG